MKLSNELVTEETNSSLFYLYCVIRCDSLQPPRFTFESGLGPLSVIVYKDLAAVVTRVPESEFSQSAIDRRLKDLEWISSVGLIHEDVIEKVMSLHETPIPMKFCTIFKSEKRIVEVLTENYAKFKSKLRQLEGSAEMGVNAFTSKAKSSRSRLWASKSDTQITRLEKKISRSSPGTAYFLKQDLARLLDAQKKSSLKSISEIIVRKMSLEAERCVTNPVFGSNNQSNVVLKRKSQTDSMFLNAAFLVKKKRIPKFKGLFRDMRRQYAHLGVRLSISGPWPPYNFSN